MAMDCCVFQACYSLQEELRIYIDMRLCLSCIFKWLALIMYTYIWDALVAFCCITSLSVSTGACGRAVTLRFA